MKPVTKQTTVAGNESKLAEKTGNEACKNCICERYIKVEGKLGITMPTRLGGGSETFRLYPVAASHGRAASKVGTR